MEAPKALQFDPKTRETLMEEGDLVKVEWMEGSGRREMNEGTTKGLEGETEQKKTVVTPGGIGRSGRKLMATA